MRVLVFGFIKKRPRVYNIHAINQNNWNRYLFNSHAPLAFTDFEEYLDRVEKLVFFLFTSKD